MTYYINQPGKIFYQPYASQQCFHPCCHFFNGEAYDADIPALRKLHPGLLTLEAYLRKNGWENAEPIPAGQNAWGS